MSRTFQLLHADLKVNDDKIRFMKNSIKDNLSDTVVPKFKKLNNYYLESINKQYDDMKGLPKNIKSVNRKSNKNNRTSSKTTDATNTDANTAKDKNSDKDKNSEISSDTNEKKSDISSVKDANIIENEMKSENKNETEYDDKDNGHGNKDNSKKEDEHIQDEQLKGTGECCITS